LTTDLNGTNRIFRFKEKKMEQFLTSKKYSYSIAGILVFFGLYLASLYNYLLFHSIAEIFSIVVACGIFMVAWNSRRFLDNNYLLLLGIAYLFVGGLDLIHTLAYKGMGVFHGYETNLATQLWTAARYMESLSLFLAPFFFGRKLKVNFVFLAYALATFLLLLSIFYWNIFPVCFIEGIGLTPFKKISEYIISLILLASIALLFNNRREFEREVLQWIVCSIIVSIASGLAFTFYIDAYGFSNLIGHFFKILSFYFIYKAIIETGLTKPYDLLFRNLKQSEVLLREEKNRIQNYLDIAGVMLVMIEADQNVSLINKKGCEILGYNENEMIGKNWLDTFIPEKNRDEVKAEFRKLADGEIHPAEYFENPILTRNGEERVIGWHNVVLRDEKGNITSTLSSGEDITERKRMAEELRKSRDELELRVQERTAELTKTNEKLGDQSRILEGFFTSTITPLVFLDRDFNFVRVNEAYAKSCQREISEFAGHNHFEFYPHEKNEAIFRKVVETKIPFQTFAKPFTFPDHPEWGVTYWDWTLTPLLDGRGEVEFLVFALEDVTERKRAEEELRAASLYARSLIEASLDPLVTISAEGKVTDVNRATELATGVPRDQLIGSDFSDYFTEPEKAREGYRQVFEIGSVKDYPLSIRHTSGDIIEVLYNAAVYRNEAGEVQGVFAAARDITERKRAEETAQSQYALREAIENSLVAGIMVVEKDGKLAHANPAFYRMTGWKEEELIGSMPPFAFWPPETLEIRAESLRALLSGKIPPKSFEARLRRKNGESFDALVVVSSLKNAQGKALGWVASIGDITQRKETERQINATNALLSLFSKKSLRKEYLDSVVDLIQSWSGCRCVGIRVLNRQGDIPYESYVGFSREFWESENWLSVQRDQCVCIRIITGKSDPQDISVITPGGSFRCGNTIEFVNHLSEEEKSRYRGVCIQNGFLSVTIIPIRYLDKIVGAIHLADEREAFVPLSTVEFLESMAPLIGEAVNRLSLEEELRESENRLRSLSSHLLTVQENERKRIAMELHDSIGQMLTAIKFKVENTLQEKGKGKARAREKSLEAIIPMVRESVEEVRRIQMDLRPSTLDDLGVLATLEWFCREYQKIYSHIHIQKEIGLRESEVSASLKTVIYRLTQEALNNIAKHSKADLIHLSLQTMEDKIELVIEDNGTGFDLEEILSTERSKRGLGLNSMRERAELSGGTFAIESTQGKGTVIRASWPV
jgi:PAS domain S-box-containing protein